MTSATHWIISGCSITMKTIYLTKDILSYPLHKNPNRIIHMIG